MSAMSGSGPLGAEAQIAWLGQPAQESACPAVEDSGPGQCSGSGATSLGADLSGLDMTSWTDSGSSREGAMAGFLEKGCLFRYDLADGLVMVSVIEVEICCDFKLLSLLNVWEDGISISKLGSRRGNVAI